MRVFDLFFEVGSRPPQIITKAGLAWREILGLGRNIWREGWTDCSRLENRACIVGEGRGWQRPQKKTSTEIWRPAVLTLVVIILGSQTLVLTAYRDDATLGTRGRRMPIDGFLLATFLCLLLILCLSFACCWVGAVECRWCVLVTILTGASFPHNNRVHI